MNASDKHISYRMSGAVPVRLLSLVVFLHSILMRPFLSVVKTGQFQLSPGVNTIFRRQQSP